MTPIKCPNCGKINDGSTDFCIYCGTIYADYASENKILIFKIDNPDINKYGKESQLNRNLDSENGQNINFSQIPNQIPSVPNKYRLAIALGYVFAILGGLIGFIFAIYLLTRKDPSAKKHGMIQLTILLIYIALIVSLIMFGGLDISSLSPFNLNNMSNITNSTNMSMTNFSHLFGF